jgi:Terpene synthase family 2, C-terminal metal binding
MLPEEYSSKTYLPVGYYPWPDLVSPHLERMGRDMEHWIDTDYTDLTESARTKYKRMRLHACTARMLATTSYEKIVPCNRFMLLYVVIDDQLENATSDEVDRMRQRVMKILTEEKPPEEYDNGADRQTAYIRDEHRAYMPAHWMEWFIGEWDYSFAYGIGAESSYKLAHHPPPLETFLVMREYSVLMYPYVCWTDIESGFVMPPFLRRHPIITRLRSLIVRVVFLQNDLHSYPKEATKDSEVFNIVKVLQYHHGMSIEAACEQAMRLHDANLAEFQALRDSLPDFGNCQEQVRHYLECMGAMVQGVNSFYLRDTPRYQFSGKGFAWPEINAS